MATRCVWTRLIAWTSLAVVLVATMCGAAQAETRRAMVIGVAKYQTARPLRNPINDAAALAASLKSVGFETTTATDPDAATMRRALDGFIAAAQNSDVVLFYFAGHGLQTRDGQNYLLATDASHVDRASLDAIAINAQRLLNDLSRGREDKVTILILDACRDDPFAPEATIVANASRAMLPATGRPADHMPEGLASLHMVGPNKYIAFATDPGRTASDGDANHANSPFTRALVEEVGKSCGSIIDTMVQVRMDVVRQTGLRQTPWDNHSLQAPLFAFRPGVACEARVASDAGRDIADWLKVRNVSDPSAYQAYLATHEARGGAFIALARAKLRALNATAESDRTLALPKIVRSVTLLWVDDNPQDLRRETADLTVLAERLGMTLFIEHAISTDDALMRLSRQNFDVVVSDMGRQEADSWRPRAGYTLLEKLRLAGSGVPFFVYSSSRKTEHLKEASDRGAQGATNHPVELLWLVSRTLAR